ncbi:c-type cytochrome [Mesorhizobium sp. M9A.F.Ca.ET.002.03.1.2]|uniref:c-type cytochrome n=1 Tax=Mesorhizobium sp. M9A.F.Ca.ET.002.03.1.2 TaxID=2493668 RepID=UPI000F759C11|nr:c-type cytochrome [Mesorhizobium sp. M9A.F.Ca.ET.002.03.1.2]AZO00881.1 c-type cytochrome [Mesorhizobium sp. M9A.F.Ca.ET.002.03.1.2]
MHISWKKLAIALAILPFVVVLAAWIGFFNVGASSGHWKITEWFLHFAMRSAVRTYALAVDVPEALPRHAIQPAAGHFARGCAICHGAPGEPRSPVVTRMLPQPPDLAGTVGEWTDAQLFRLVKHGVRFTGMPAWPAQERDDEVWAMVAFLRELPSMDEATYRDLAYGERLAPPAGVAGILRQALADCARCHGEDGLGRGPAIPVLAGQSEAYLLESLRAYAAGGRASGMMSLPAIAAGSHLWPDLARHFAALPTTDPDGGGDPALVRRGKEIAGRGVKAASVPACLGCHGRQDRSPLYPSIAGQPERYIEAQLGLFRAGKRGGTRFGHLMANAAKGLTNEDIRALAAYFSLPAASSATGVQ